VTDESGQSALGKQNAIKWSDGDGQDGPRPRNTLPIASLACGVFAILVMLVLSQVVLGILFGVIAIVLAIFGLRAVRRGVADRRSWALTGLITGVLAILISAVLLILSYRVYSDCRDKIGHKPSTSELKNCSKN
jgi:VIT1/CCC1 family predicted Fe2+/Mn2+ transporter